MNAGGDRLFQEYLTIFFGDGGGNIRSGRINPCPETEERARTTKRAGSAKDWTETAAPESYFSGMATIGCKEAEGGRSSKGGEKRRSSPVRSTSRT